MQKKALYILCCIILCTGCSTTKNTGATRAFHGMKVVHNVYFNGQISYQEGLDAIHKANEDDYSTILNLYPISNPKTQQSATSQMDKSIEKCRKCIKLHSIHSRPKKVNTKRRNDPKYKAWLNSKEFNPQMYRAWMLLAQSEFHKGDFLGSIGTFTYIAKLYETDPDLVAQCQLWMARAYGEMGWQYEAEDLLGKVKIDNLKQKHQPFYSAVSADILLKGQHYKEAIPYIKLSKGEEKRKGYKPRFEFVLAQLYQQNGQRDAARAGYKRVINMQPEHIMRFNAQLRYYELLGDTTKSVKKLQKMAKLDKNKDVLDQIYGTLGNIYLNAQDTDRALEYYQLAIEKSTQNGKDKAGVLLTAGNLYYEGRDYEHAAPCYTEAVQIIPAEDIRYAEANKRAQNLAELVQRIQTVTLQDSLQYLSTLSEKEQREIVDQIISDLKKQEEADSLQAAGDARLKELDGPLQGVNTDLMIGGNKDDSWYFYNENLLKKGKQSFAKTWGNRPLEDNWRRTSKNSLTPSAVPEQEESTEERDVIPDSTAQDSTQVTPPVTDPHQPEYYLQQIPKTQEDIDASNVQIADALYDMVFIYRDKLKDYEMSDETFQEFCRRFKDDERLVDLYYSQYMNALRREEPYEAERYRQDLIRLFPDSKQATIVSNPDYAASLQRTAAMQDSLYEATYLAYRKGDYTAVKANKQLAEKEYPLTSLMPRFLFLNAVGVARTEGQKAFTNELQDMVARYPDHELSTMAKNMLALMGEGLQSQKGGAPESLQDKRGKVEEESADSTQVMKFSTERKEASYVLIIIPQDEKQLGNLLYQVAVFNFTQFLIKDFDLQTIASFSAKESALQLSGFETMDEADWYISLMQADSTIHNLLGQLGAKVVTITESNFKLLGTLGMEEYEKSQLPQAPPSPAPKKKGKK